MDITSNPPNPAFNILWAPWRMEYIKNSSTESGCVFCGHIEYNDDAKHHIFLRRESCFAMLNRYPYTNGHILAVPNKHTSDLEDLEDNELLDLMKLCESSVKLLKETMSPDGFNIGLNLGLSAGAGIADHLHFHIVPRWQGDTNFTTVVSQTRVVPQSLEEVYSIFTEKLGRK